MWHVDIPAVMPIIAIMFIMRATSIIVVGFEKCVTMGSDKGSYIQKNDYKKGYK